MSVITDTKARIIKLISSLNHHLTTVVVPVFLSARPSDYRP